MEKTCKDCVHVEICKLFMVETPDVHETCDYFKDRARFVELPEGCKITADLKRAVRRLALFYTMACESEYVNSPLPWALYETWKHFDILSRKKERENNEGE